MAPKSALRLYNTKSIEVQKTFKTAGKSYSGHFL